MDFKVTGQRQDVKEMEISKTVSVDLADITVKVDALWAKRVTQIRANNLELQPLVYAAWKLLDVSAGRPVKGAATFAAWLADRRIPERTGQRILHREQVRLGEKVTPEQSIIPPVAGLPDDDEDVESDIPAIAHTGPTRFRGMDEEVENASLVDNPVAVKSAPQVAAKKITVKKEPQFRLSQDVQSKADRLMKLFARESDGIAYVNSVMDDILDTEIERRGKVDKLVSITGVSTVVASRHAPVKNDDGVSIKGCSLIYAPEGQAGEYSVLAANPYRGCGHGCAYCYVPNVTKQPRVEFDAGAVPRFDYIKRLEVEAEKYQRAGITEQVMLSFTTDPYHPGDTALTTKTLQVLKDRGMAFCALTKGGTRSLRDLAMFRPDRDAFACTLTSLDDTFSKKWERNAALPADRIEALSQFHDAGIFTWASLEPTLDVESSLQIIRKTHTIVDLFKVGKANYIPMSKTVDWKDYTHRVIDLCKELNVRHYIKEDLQMYLPEGYANPKRVPQHN
jgi:DNA repair photolyase